MRIQPPGPPLKKIKIFLFRFYFWIPKSKWFLGKNYKKEGREVHVIFYLLRKSSKIIFNILQNIYPRRFSDSLNIYFYFGTEQWIKKVNKDGSIIMNKFLTPGYQVIIYLSQEVWISVLQYGISNGNCQTWRFVQNCWEKFIEFLFLLSRILLFHIKLSSLKRILFNFVFWLLPPIK